MTSAKPYRVCSKIGCEGGIKAKKGRAYFTPNSFNFILNFARPLAWNCS